MFWDMAVVLKATQDVPAASALGSCSTPGTVAKTEILETHGNMTSPGKVQPPDSEFDHWDFSKSFQSTVFWSPSLSNREY